MYKTILVEKKNHLAILSFNRPEKLNAINLQVKREVSQALIELEADDDVRVVIMTGAGRAFSSGYDITAPESELEEFMSLKEEEKLLNLDKPTIAAIQGYALGDGLQQALLCDIRVAADDSVLGFIGPLIGGLCYSAFSILPQVVGRGKANELLFTCSRISAEEAYRIGLVNKVAPREQLMPAAVEMAEQIAKIAPLLLKYSKRMLRQDFFGTDYKNRLREGLKVIASQRNLPGSG
ncbi:MAG: enoyl-CoA hydratase/isomerase family protein [Chloroflexota bacterium]|nr:enoyl-CoA hydratase/isomerase family protein [Chloroflexota bacterium]